MVFNVIACLLMVPIDFASETDIQPWKWALKIDPPWAPIFDPPRLSK
jgi:hypothetical protein